MKDSAISDDVVYINVCTKMIKDLDCHNTMDPSITILDAWT